MKNIITREEREAIYDNMAQLLDEYNYTYTSDALYEIIDTWAENKANLISLFKKHPNYVEGKFMIAFDKDWNRNIDPNGAYDFANWMKMYLDIVIDNFSDEVKEAVNEYNNEYPWDQERYPGNAYFFFYCASEYAKQFVDARLEQLFNNVYPSLKIKEGMKTSRAVNKLCTWLGFNKLIGFNKEFAKFADSVNPLKITRHTVISLNPIDYLTMSFGNSWASCHTIDKTNKRDMPNSYEGQYSSGTVSYMLDKVSMVFYTVDASYNGNDYYFEDKINRNMFHYGKDKLIQARVYPQCNDGEGGIYKDIREIVQRVISDCLEIPNYWVTKHGVDNIRPYIRSEGTHYPDYTNFSSCCISFPKEMEINEDRITIGHWPICVECGQEHSESECINHCSYRGEGYECNGCGCMVGEDDVRWVGDYAYCSDCVTYCDRCERYVTNENARWVESFNGYVCDECLDEDFTQCDCCEEYYRDYDVIYIESTGQDVCDNCRRNNFTMCDRCNELYPDDEVRYDEVREEYFCNDCWEDVHEEEENEEEE